MKTIFVLLAVVCGTSTLQAQEEADSGSFFVRLGSDTIAVERYTRTSFQLVSEAITRTPLTRRVKLTVTFKDDGTVSWWEVVNSPVSGVPNSPPVARQLITLLGDSASVELWFGGVQRSLQKFAAHPRLVPVVTPFYSTYETAIQRARRAPADTLLTMMAGNAPLHYVVKYPTPDSATLFHPQSGTNSVKLDKQGRMLRFNGEATTFKVVVTRSKPVDLTLLAVRFAKADAAGKSIGALSPRDTVEEFVSSTNVLVDYSRPSKRGRVIFGGIVPWDQVWRTGANAATQLELSAPIIVNGTEVPKGKYTLWSIPSKKGWQLIINKQTGQWGTNYDPKQDLLRVPLVVESIPVPIETFTVAVLDKGKGNGAISFAWDRVRATLPFRVVQ
jgi:hypothetical protein